MKITEAEEIYIYRLDTKKKKIDVVHVPMSDYEFRDKSRVPYSNPKEIVIYWDGDWGTARTLMVEEGEINRNQMWLSKYSMNSAIDLFVNNLVEKQAKCQKEIERIDKVIDELSLAIE